MKIKNDWSVGTHNQSAGTWSDDTSMMTATMEWFGEMLQGKEMKNNYKGGYYDSKDYYGVGSITIKYSFTGCFSETCYM